MHETCEGTNVRKKRAAFAIRRLDLLRHQRTEYLEEEKNIYIK